MRPLLVPALSRLWRDATTLQLGVDPERAVVLTAVDPPLATFLTSLDGRRTLDAVLAAAPPGIQAAELIGRLLARGAIVDAATLTPSADTAIAAHLASALLTHGPEAADRVTARRRAHVLVRCKGRVGPLVAALLAAGGVGRVTVTGSGVVAPDDVTVGGLGPDDVGRPYVLATIDAIRKAAPTVDTSANSTPDFVVLAAGPLPLPADQVRWTSSGVPHLPVLLRDGVAIVGPLVVPGRTACLSCVEAHRRDRDPAWPVLAAQLATERKPELADASVVSIGAALAAAETTGHLEGVPTAALGVSLEAGPPGVPLRQRPWPPHPRCGCLPGSSAAGARQ
ncbi:TOMM precursor leader peptide-binding protein [Cryptosporangium phraense]|uniref:TOMM leader peptide-binding protein n=1 Tax=Cryptosporangium phraense TaxID=2593070 RepID=A0A545ALV9_9ACTN|nr:TOMM precursor leader peptide-binding protein [Cryptosporangium phraense]TQS42307.1 TOMM precursor leader peptide-binding protein [Cryptosporangium phraense]